MKSLMSLFWKTTTTFARHESLANEMSVVFSKKKHQVYLFNTSKKKSCQCIRGIMSLLVTKPPLNCLYKYMMIVKKSRRNSCHCCVRMCTCITVVVLLYSTVNPIP